MLWQLNYALPPADFLSMIFLATDWWPSTSCCSRPMTQQHTHPCLTCGACCAFFRVAFHWSETDPFVGGNTPPELTEKLDPHRVAMIGTSYGKQPRCTALVGIVGECASCQIYDKRPSPCRALQPAWENGEPSPQCDKARAAHGLNPLTPDSFPDKPKPLPNSA